MLLSLNQHDDDKNLAFASYYGEPEEQRLRMDEYMQMKIEQSVDDRTPGERGLQVTVD